MTNFVLFIIYCIMYIEFQADKRILSYFMLSR